MQISVATKPVRVHCLVVASETATNEKDKDMHATAEIWEIRNGQIVDKHNLWEVMEKIGTVCHKAAEAMIAKASGNLAIAMVMTTKGWKRA